MIRIWSWTSYLRISVEDGSLRLWQDVLPTALLTSILAFPYSYFHQTNFFGSDGFLSKVTSLTSSLSGFYVAGLVAVAAFVMPNNSLDKRIEVGPVYLPLRGLGPGGDDRALRRALSRREYVCYIFGYLSAMCILLTLVFTAVSGLASSLSTEVNGLFYDLRYFFLARGVVITLFCVPLCHMIVTTGWGLYYLAERIYAREPKILPRRSASVLTTSATATEASLNSHGDPENG